MFIEAELQFRHYKPDKLEVGMMFLDHINPGHPEKEKIEVWRITEDYFHETISDETLIEENGFPVQCFIITDGLIITPEEIGTFILFNEAEDEECYVEFDVTEMNFILREFDGWVDVLIDEDTVDDFLMEPIYDDENDNKVILKFIDEEV
jgi:hypothetical protein|tara:strand:+ start:53 stop:502 length:450 start_codon:yes stop_codon:yes gene_type:complete